MAEHDILYGMPWVQHDTFKVNIVLIYGWLKFLIVFSFDSYVLAIDVERQCKKKK